MRKAVPAILAAAPLLAGSLAQPAHAQPQPAQTQPAQTQPAPTPAPSRAQQLMGDVDPKLADLTDGVLYGDV